MRQSVSVCYTSRTLRYCILAFVAGQLPQEPPQTVRPIDEIEMTTVFQCSLVLAPLATSYTDQTVIWALDALNDTMRLSKH